MNLFVYYFVIAVYHNGDHLNCFRIELNKEFLHIYITYPVKIH